MKKILIAISLCVTFCYSVGFSAEYKIREDDVIGTIAIKTGYPMEQIAKLNGIKGPMYVVHAGSIIRYISENDFANAQAWVEYYLEGLYPEHQDYDSFMKILEDIKARNIEHDGDSGTHADEVILFAKLYHKQLEV